MQEMAGFHKEYFISLSESVGLNIFVSLFLFLRYANNFLAKSAEEVQSWQNIFRLLFCSFSTAPLQTSREILL